MKRLLSTTCSDASFNIAVLLLRIAAGVLLFVDHGIPHITSFSSKQYSFFDPFGIGSRWSLLLLIFAEVFCTVFTVLGLFARLAAIPVVIAMGVAVFMFHKGQPLREMEPAVVFLTMFMAILFTGPGKYSVDAAMGR